MDKNAMFEAVKTINRLSREKAALFEENERLKEELAKRDDIIQGAIIRLRREQDSPAIYGHRIESLANELENALSSPVEAFEALEEK